MSGFCCASVWIGGGFKGWSWMEVSGWLGGLSSVKRSLSDVERGGEVRKLGSFFLGTGIFTIN